MRNLNIKLALLIFAIIVILSAGIPYLSNQNEIESKNKSPGIKTIPENEEPVRINENPNETKNHKPKNKSSNKTSNKKPNT